jgi:hypothetical protein
MDLTICITGSSLGDDQVAASTRELLKDIRSDADPRARTPVHPAGAGSKGDFAILGQIVLSLISDGAVGSFIEAAFGFLARHRRLEVEISNPDGRKLKLKWDFIDREGEKKAVSIVKDFLKAG